MWNGRLGCTSRASGMRQFDRKYVSEDGGKRSERDHTETYLCAGKTHVLPIELPDQELGH